MQGVIRFPHSTFFLVFDFGFFNNCIHIHDAFSRGRLPIIEFIRSFLLNSTIGSNLFEVSEIYLNSSTCSNFRFI